ncbi:MAG: ABC transporter substrate-binding protein [Chloroflexi bacterium]|nr:ABC transporter substrate-binding protein [Chloroflexota bacterium]
MKRAAMARTPWLLGLVLLLLALAVGCQGAAPTPTPLPPTPTKAPTVQPTAVPSAPTPTAAVAAPAPTRILPTPTPKPATAVQPKKGGVLIHANRGNIRRLDPQWDTSITVQQWQQTMFPNNLVTRKPDEITTIIPNLAERWEMTGKGEAFTFYLRPNVVWHDGTPFTAEDVKFWIELNINPPKGRLPNENAELFGPVAGVDVLNPLTVRVRFKSPNPRFLNSLTVPGNEIAQPRHLYAPAIAKGDPNVDPSKVGWVGLGAFKMKNYNFPTFIEVERFDRYWRPGLPYLDGVRFILFNDSATQFAAFRTGRLDATTRGSGYHLTPEQVDILKREMGDKVWFGQMLSSHWAPAPNGLIAPWNDVRLRKAVNLWLDRPAGVKTVHGGQGVIGTILAPNLTLAGPGVLEKPGFRVDKTADRAEAKRLLAEVGLPAGFKTKLLTRDIWTAWGEYMAEQLRTLGIQADMDVVDNATRSDRLSKGAFDIHVGTVPFVFPEEAVADLASTSVTAQVKHNDPKVDRLLGDIANAMDPVEYQRLSRELEQYMVFDQAYIWSLWWELAVQGYRSYVKGVDIPAVRGQHNNTFDTVWLDK